ncbi:bifunctional acetaldehyde-CoA/alcohol dehydrogenase [Spiroplasma eriocheiris]|uniref:Aldehyde-alcohol dehydrogenase n=1 Tax=Spiroplasma eriocheiris TaxID=315358 RepID=A0A0H3XHC0_9MOLU|nr:bifunctional acetaldehyde-CoA/alcohol dehydrogenase [Spiroplasma eriocheiris]AHF57596.1 aldehyde-alcohol dehydrogenase [Spiroplasma eriocheiris CCTCC M 207170]AKM54053.1 acetaldehyde dehydrogenase [Spiroplasma eriocheiris]
MENKKIEALITKVSAAQKQFATYNQEQVDKIFHAAAIAANKARIELAIDAVNETNMGIVEDKIIKNHYAAEYIHNKYRDMKTVGVYEENLGLGYQLVYEPVGVIAAVIPTTNPTATAIFKTLIALKTRNGIIISPHPGAKNCTIKAAKVVLDAAVAAGAPKDIIAWVEDAQIQDTTDLMGAADLILATGGPGMVKSAYSSGKPALGVGAGNCPAIITELADLDVATSSIMQSNTFDNGVICATENSVIVLEKVYDKVVKLFEQKNGYVMTKKEDLDKVRKAMFKEGKYGILNPALVGQTPQTIAKITGVTIPTNTRLILCPAEKSSHDEPLAHEKLSTYVGLYKAKDFNHALAIAKDLLTMGPGHTASLWTDEIKGKAEINLWRDSLNDGRMVVNMPSSLGAVGDMYNFQLAPSFTLGCGSWGGNSTSVNIGPQHLLNTKTVAVRRENMQWMRLPERIYHKFGCLPFALQDLKEWNCKKAFIVTDPVINELYGQKVTSVLEQLGIKYDVFADVEPNPTFATTERGVKSMKNSRPDVVIAIGGGSAMDAAKMIWLLEQHPDAKFADLAMTFNDIRKRVVKFPTMTNGVKLVCIPTTSGTGSEVTPFSVITDDKTHIKYPLADYALTPHMAIVDPELTLTVPKGGTNAPALDAMTHLFEAYVSALATDYTDPYCLQGIKTIFTYLPDAYHNGSSAVKARSKMADAATQAGMAFANAFLGLVHSMSHKIGGEFEVIHGAANSILLPYVIRYNAATLLEGGKQTYFSQYTVANSLERYAEIARYCGVKGSSDSELVDNLISNVQKLSKDVELASSFKEYFERYQLNVSEKDFLAALDKMSQDAFDDQCTPANPRIPLLTDIKQIYLDAYHGNPVPSLKK